MPDAAASADPGTSDDPRSWRPMRPYRGRRTFTISDPVLEPFWSGQRVLAHVTAASAADRDPRVLLGDDEGEDLGAELPELAAEVRQRLIDVVSKTGGHIGAGLGVVELTVALLYAFDSPRDKIVWDVGHQGYPWKVLTGRNDRLPTLRQQDGLSGFLRRVESPHDQAPSVRSVDTSSMKRRAGTHTRPSSFSTMTEVSPISRMRPITGYPTW